MIRESCFLPHISRQNYKAIRDLPGSDLPDTYDEWFKLFAKERLEYGQVGYDVHELEVDPCEFTRYCRAIGMSSNGQRLLNFAEEKASGSQY
jgi:hypothetical protein